jgi:hypothetical protein
MERMGRKKQKRCGQRLASVFQMLTLKRFGTQASKNLLYFKGAV